MASNITNRRFVESGQLTTSPTTFYTAPVATRSIIKKVTVTNTSAAALTVNVYLVASAGAAGSTNINVQAQSVGAGQTVELYTVENQTLETGDFISASATTGAVVNLMVSGIEVLI
jgi:hypothetical protein